MNQSYTKAERAHGRARFNWTTRKVIMTVKMEDTRKFVTISIKPYKDELGNWRVDCIVSGLKNEEQALRAADFITSMLCGEESQVAT